MTKLLLEWPRDSAPLGVVRTLRSRGHEAYLAGGCVRDLRLGLVPKDHDVATSATPDQVRDAFRRTIPVQTELGVTMVLWGDERIEVTTFRSEGPYLDGRHPSRVGATDAEGDVQRRDFTINGLLLDPETGEIHDHVGGLADLDAGILRCIRDPRDRFEEDHLRILRAVRFAVRFGLRIEEGTWRAMVEHADRTAKLSGERVHEELSKMEAQGSFARSVELLLDAGVLRAQSPELDAALADSPSRHRLLAWLEAPAEDISGLWPALLGLPLSPWWPAPRLPGPVAPLAPAARRLLERLRCSRQQVDIAQFVWSRWPTCWEQPVPPPSHQAALVRDRSWPALSETLARARSVEPDLWSPRTHLADLAARIPPAPPALGDAFLAAGLPKGPLLGQAIREADRLHLDQGLPLDAALVERVAETILGGT